MNHWKALTVGLAIALTVALSPTGASQADVAAAEGDPGQITYADRDVQRAATRSVTGTFSVATRDRRSGASEQVYAIESTTSGFTEVHFRQGAPRVPSGTPVTALIAEDGSVAVATFTGQRVRSRTEPTEPQTPRAHRLYIAKVSNVGDYAYDDATIESKVDAALQRWTVESDGMITSFTRSGEITPYETEVDCGNGSALYSEAQAVFPDVSFSHGEGTNHLLVVVPPGSGCAFAVGSNGSPDAPFGGGRSTVTAGGALTQALMHEIGHNFSLAHADLEECDPDCTVDEYGNGYNFMGSSYPDEWGIISLSSVQRRQLGVTGECEVPEVTLPEGRSTITRSYDVWGRGTGAGTRGVIATDPVTGKVYNLDWRNRLGRDDGAIYGTFGTPKNLSGLVVERYEPDRHLDLQTFAPREPGDGLDRSRLVGEEAVRGGMTVRLDSTVGEVDPDVTGSQPPVAQITVTLTDPEGIAEPLPAQKGRAVIAGNVVPSSTVVARTQGWTPGSCYRYQWKVDGVPIAGAIEPRFAIPAGWKGRRLSVVIAGQQSTRATLVRTAAPIRIGFQRFTKTSKPQIRGQKRVGKQLRAKTGKWSPQPTKYQYRWYANNKLIKGAKSKLLKLKRAHASKKIKVRVRAVRPGYQTTQRFSKATKKIRQ